MEFQQRDREESEAKDAAYIFRTKQGDRWRVDRDTCKAKKGYVLNE